ncbi:MAG: hypothetical protein QGH15_12855 [Kiritimatiellia bacterium]|nr:hypothetical protein [Kiritimatiellia bacterium]
MNQRRDHQMPAKVYNIGIRPVLIFAFTLLVQSVGMAEDDGLIKIEPDWVRRWKDKADSHANAWDVTIHRNGVYAAGVIGVSRFPKVAPLIIQRYTVEGELVWEKRWKGYKGMHGTGAGATVIVGEGPYLYVGGAVAREKMNASLIQKWDTNGQLLWTEFWGEPNGGHHEVNGLAIVGDSLYVSHYSAAKRLITIDAVIKKFSIRKLDSRRPQAESLIWSTTYGKADSHNTTDGHIYADTTGVYICGQYGGTKGWNVYKGGDAYLAKFDPEGNQKWIELWQGDGTGCDNAFNLTSDGDHIFITGPTMAKDRFIRPNVQIFVQKYTMTGNLVWTRLFGGPKPEYSRGLAVDKQYVFVAVATKSFGDKGDNTVLLKYDKESGELKAKGIWGGKGFDGATTSIALDATSVYLSGKSSSADDGTATGKTSAVVLKTTK